MAKSINPHDHFFSKAFAQPALVRDFINAYLPATITNQLDLATLTLQSASFVDEALDEHFSDMLYRVQSVDDKPVHIYFLFEHKSYPERWVAYQLLRYMLEIWDQWLTELRELRKTQPSGGKEPLMLTPIIPVVVYHGDKQWQVAHQFSALIDAPSAWLQWMPAFEYLINDFSTAANTAIVGTAMTRFVLRLLRHAREQTLLDHLPDILTELTHFADSEMVLHLLTIGITYMMKVRQDIQVEDYQRALRQAHLPQGERLAMSLAEQLINQGRQEGLQKGLQKGLLETRRSDILSILLLRFNIRTVELEEQLAQIVSAETLKTLLHAAVTAETYPEFLSHLKMP